MKQDNACGSGTQQYLARPGPSLCLRCTERLTRFLASPNPRESHAGRSCPHRSGFNFP